RLRGAHEDVQPARAGALYPGPFLCERICKTLDEVGEPHVVHVEACEAPGHLSAYDPCTCVWPYRYPLCDLLRASETLLILSPLSPRQDEPEWFLSARQYRYDGEPVADVAQHRIENGRSAGPPIRDVSRHHLCLLGVYGFSQSRVALD